MDGWLRWRDTQHRQGANNLTLRLHAKSRGACNLHWASISQADKFVYTGVDPKARSVRRLDRPPHFFYSLARLVSGLPWLVGRLFLRGSISATRSFLSLSIDHLYYLRVTWAETWALHVYSGEDLCGSRLRHARIVGVVARLGGRMRTTRWRRRGWTS